MIVAYVTAMVILLVGAVAQGKLSNRWGLAVDSSDEKAILNAIPRSFGDWETREEPALPPAALQILECEAAVNRVYFNRRTGTSVVLTVLLGPPGPLSVHTPEICLSSRDYVQVGPPEKLKLFSGATESEYQRAAFRPTLPTAPYLEILYGWNDRSGWRAPDSPRFTYAGKPLLYKVQVASQLWANVTSGENGAAAEFLKGFVEATTTHFAEQR